MRAILTTWKELLTIRRIFSECCTGEIQPDSLYIENNTYSRSHITDGPTMGWSQHATAR